MLLKKGKPLWQITIWISVNVNSHSLPNFDTSVQSYSQMTFCECAINFSWWLCTFIVLMSLKLYLSSPKTIILIYIAVLVELEISISFQKQKKNWDFPPPKFLEKRKYGFHPISPISGCTAIFYLLVCLLFVGGPSTFRKRSDFAGCGNIFHAEGCGFELLEGCFLCDRKCHHHLFQVACRQAPVTYKTNGFMLW